MEPGDLRTCGNSGQMPANDYLELPRVLGKHYLEVRRQMQDMYSTHRRMFVPQDQGVEIAHLWFGIHPLTHHTNTAAVAS